MEADPTPRDSGATPGRSGERGLRADPLSAMTPRFNLFFRWFARRFFRDFDVEDAAALLKEYDALVAG